MKKKLIVMKFGGTSVGDAARIQDVARIVADSQKIAQVIVVVSAMSTVTNLLLEAAVAASKRDKKIIDSNLDALEKLHTTTIHELQLGKEQEKALLKKIIELIAELKTILQSVFALEEITHRGMDLISSFGERMSIHIVAAAISHLDIEAVPIEASDLIVTTDVYGNARPLLKESAKLMKPKITKLFNRHCVPVVTGFIGATKDGVITTLGRGGSDYSATIIGNCLDADEVWIWTDVDGVMTADPRIVIDAKTIPTISYDEASELSYFGAKVLHPLTMMPASLKSIPIWIKNTMNPEGKGTKISHNANGGVTGGKALSTITGLTLVTLQGKGMIGVPGIAAKLFDTIAAQQINILFISQASSEYNISFVVRKEDGERSVQTLQDAFKFELREKFIETVQKEDGLALVALIGEGMKGHPGIAGKTFSALGNSQVNVIAIAQGSSERNISFVVKEEDVKNAIQSIHDEFALGGS